MVFDNGKSRATLQISNYAELISFSKPYISEIFLNYVMFLKGHDMNDIQQNRLQNLTDIYRKQIEDTLPEIYEQMREN